MTDSVANELWVYVGTYTRRESHVEGKSAGIQLLKFNTDSGSLGFVTEIPGIENPTYLALHPEGTALYAISEVSDYDGKAAGGAFAYRIDPESRQLSLINSRTVKGTGPAYITIDGEGKNILVANYGGGSASVLPVQPDLSLGPISDFVQHEGSSVNPQRQEAPHAHSIVLDGQNRFALCADLGIDKVMIYRYDADAGTITPNADQPWARTKSGAGPRHIVFADSQAYVYVINELDSTITVYSYDAEKGVLTEVQTITTLPADFDGRNYTADIHIHPSGSFLYGSNRGHDSIAIYDIDAETGQLSNYRHVSSGGEYPRGFVLDPSGRYALVANQNSDNIVVYDIDEDTGGLTPSGVELKVPTPVCLKVMH